MTDNVKIAVLDNEMEAQLLDAVLEDQNIPHVMRSYRDSAYDGLYQMQKGWGAVYGLKSDEERIMRILGDIRATADS